MTEFNYNLNIPDGPNNPSNDQPLMQENTNSIFGILEVDHVGFTVENGGTHEQVTFSSNNPPTFPDMGSGPLPFPVLFTNTSTVIPQLFFNTGTALQSADQYTIGDNGSVLLFGGIIMKWATVIGNLTSTTFTSLGLANFQNNAFVAMATPKSGSGTAIVTALSTTAITVGAASSAPCYVLIIGN